jgi:hypothetical protein
MKQSVSTDIRNVPILTTLEMSPFSYCKFCKIVRSGQTKLLDRWLELPPQQIAPVYRSSACIGENQISRIAIPRPLPSCTLNTLQDSERIKGDAPRPASVFRIIKFAFVKTALRFRFDPYLPSIRIKLGVWKLFANFEFLS